MNRYQVHSGSSTIVQPPWIAASHASGNSPSDSQNGSASAKAPDGGRAAASGVAVMALASHRGQR